MRDARPHVCCSEHALAGLGAQLTSGANLDFSVVGLSALTENLDASLAIYADVVLNPAFAPAEIERLKRLQVAGIQQEKSTPTSLAMITRSSEPIRRRKFARWADFQESR